jgi:hypothetical protein
LTAAATLFVDLVTALPADDALIARMNRDLADVMSSGGPTALKDGRDDCRN